MSRILVPTDGSEHATRAAAGKSWDEKSAPRGEAQPRTGLRPGDAPCATGPSQRIMTAHSRHRF